jgi:two-component system, LytTR family, response regulator AlgR
MAETLRVLIVDDEPLAVERMQVVCARLAGVEIAGTASDGAAALRLIEALQPDLVLLDITMPLGDGLTVARALARWDNPPAIVFVTAHDGFAVEAFDLEAVDYVLKPVSPERLDRAIRRVAGRRGSPASDASSPWLREIWVPHHEELLRIAADEVRRIDAERDYVRIHVEARSFLLLQTITGLAARLDPARFIRIHRSHILRRDFIAGLRHEGMGVWSAQCGDGEALRIGRTYLAAAKKMAGKKMAGP